MTTLLPPNELAFFRSIAKTAAVLLICLRLDELNPGCAVAAHEIADILEVDPRTVNKQLRSLSAYGLVLEQRENKYVVTPLGRNTLFANRQRTALSIEENEKIDGEPFPNAQIVPHELIDDESESNHESDLDSSSIIESTNCARLLEATHLLFGTPVNTSGITDRNSKHALAWISKAYADRRKLNNPQGLVYARLRDDARPPVYLLKDPAQGLPDEYLIAVGLMDDEPSAQDLGDEDDEPVDAVLSAYRERWKNVVHYALTEKVDTGPLKSLISQISVCDAVVDDTLVIRIDPLFKRVVEWIMETPDFMEQVNAIIRESGEDICVRFVVR